MNKIILFLAFILSWSIVASSQESLGRFNNEDEAKEYYANNIASLDPIEGIYEARNIVVASVPGYGSEKIVQDFVWFIYSFELSGKEYFNVCSISGPVKGIIGIIERVGETKYYKLSRGDGKGNSREERFVLEDLFSFGYSYKDSYRKATSTVSLTAVKKYPTRSMYEDMIKKSQAAAEAEANKQWTGSGFALTDGYLVTNYHVVESAKTISVYGVNGDMVNMLLAETVAMDKVNDLAILKIKDNDFTGFDNTPYAISNQMAEVGEDIWVLGYPLTQVLGNEIKLTTGVVSSRSGYKGDVSTYQISAPVQPGNSGGPLFDSEGNVVGIINAGIPGAENVGYAIKTSYLKNLAESYSLSSYLPTKNTISSLSLKDRVKRVKNYVLFLICSKEGAISSSSLSPSPSSSSSSSNTSNNDRLRMVDLGLSVKWADRNLGASSASNIGDWFAWGETIPKTEFKRENYLWYNDKRYSYPDGLKDISGSIYDPAHTQLGEEWRMPTQAEIDELITMCQWRWTSMNGINGYRVTGKNGNSIFIPVNGTKAAKYWSGEISISQFLAYAMGFDENKFGCYDDMRERWGGVRPVYGEKALPKTSKKKADEAYAEAIIWYDQKNFRQAYEALNKSISIMPTTLSHGMRGRIALNYLFDYETAKDSFIYCINNGEDTQSNRISYALSLSHNKEYQKAIEQFDYCLKEYPTKDAKYVGTLYNSALCYAKMEDWSHCASICQTIIKNEEQVAFEYELVYNLLARSYLNLNQVKNAVSPIKKALKLNHNKGYIWDTDGEVHYKTGNYEDCIVSMNNALTIYKNEGDVKIANSYYYRGLAKIKSGNIAGGYVDLEKASDLGESKASEELKKIKVSDIDFSDNSTFKKIIEGDISSTSAGNDLKIVMIEMTEESTVVYMQYTNTKYNAEGWYSINPDAYIRDKLTGKKYSLLTAQNCALRPRSTPIEKGKTNSFTLIFPALPEGTKRIDLVESEDSTWKFYNISLQ